MKTRKLFNTVYDRFLPSLTFVTIICSWQLLSWAKALPLYVFPSPIEIVVAFWNDKYLLLQHSLVTLQEAVIGLFLGIIIALTLAILMDFSQILKRSLYPLLVVTQTIPTVAIAPVLVLWLGFGMTPKIVLIVLTTTFPIVISVMDGFFHCDEDAIVLLKLMNASTWQLMWHVKLPGALSYFFAGLRVSVSYAFIAAVVSEWLGGFSGLGVYMTRVKKAFLYDSMFAVIVLISIISLLSMAGVKRIERRFIPWKFLSKR